MSVNLVCNLINECLAQWFSWLERKPVTLEVEGSSPFWVVFSKTIK